MAAIKKLTLVALSVLLVGILSVAFRQVPQENREGKTYYAVVFLNRGSLTGELKTTLGSSNVAPRTRFGRMSIAETFSASALAFGKENPARGTTLRRVMVSTGPLMERSRGVFLQTGTPKRSSR